MTLRRCERGSCSFHSHGMGMSRANISPKPLAPEVPMRMVMMFKHWPSGTDLSQKYRTGWHAKVMLNPNTRNQAIVRAAVTKQAMRNLREGRMRR